MTQARLLWVGVAIVTTAWNDCNANTVFDAGTDTESVPSNKACATAQ